MASRSSRKRPSGTANRGRAKSGRRAGPRGAPALVRSLGLVALGAALALGATAYGDLPKRIEGALPRLTAMVERFMPAAEQKPAPPRPAATVAAQRQQPERTRLPRVTRPDRSIETAAVPAPRPPKPLDGKKHPDGAKVVALRPPVDASPRPRAAVPEAAPPREAAPAARGARPVTLTGLSFPICGEGPGKNCVIDGDTFVINGKAYRVADIDTPEAGNPKCMREAALAAKATRRLQALLNAGPIELHGTDRDEDVYGRKLRTVHRDGRSLGAVLVSEGLAHRWTGRKQSWCA